MQINRNNSKFNLLIMSLPSSAFGMALSAQIAVLSWLLSTRYNLDISQIAFVWAAGPIAGILGQIGVGSISDKLWIWGGRRKFFIILSGLLSALSMFSLFNLKEIAGFLHVTNLAIVAVACATILDLSINIGFGPSRALIADLTNEGKDRARAFLWMQTISGSLGVLIYALGAIFGNAALIPISAVLVILFTIGPSLITKESLQTRAREQEVAQSINTLEALEYLISLAPMLIFAIASLVAKIIAIQVSVWFAAIAIGATCFILISINLSNKTTRKVKAQRIFGAHSFSWVGCYCLFIFLVPYIEQRFIGIGKDELGKVASTGFLVFNLVGALAPMLILRPLTNKFAQNHVHALAIFIMAIAFGGIGLGINSPISLFTLLAFAGIGWGSIVSLPFAAITQIGDNGQSGLLMGLFNLSVVIPQLVVSFGIGAAVQRFPNLGIVFLIAASALLFSAFNWRIMKPEKTSEVNLWKAN